MWTTRSKTTSAVSGILFYISIYKKPNHTCAVLSVLPRQRTGNRIRTLLYRDLVWRQGLLYNNLSYSWVNEISFYNKTTSLHHYCHRPDTQNHYCHRPNTQKYDLRSYCSMHEMYFHFWCWKHVFFGYSDILETEAKSPTLMDFWNSMNN